MDLNYGNVFVGYVEAEMFFKYVVLIPEQYGGYPDNCIGSTTLSPEQPDAFHFWIHFFLPSLKLSTPLSDTSIAFCDILIHMYTTKTKTHTPTSAHPTSNPTKTKNPSPTSNSSIYAPFVQMAGNMRLSLNSRFITSSCLDILSPISTLPLPGHDM